MTHRFLDGHPQLFVYPFESQLGTRGVIDALSSTFPVKYRWPVFALHASASEDYHAIIDEECKVRARTPHVSKFRHVPFDFSDDERQRRYIELAGQTGRSRASNVAAFFRATFDAWKDHRRTGEERAYVGYSPIIVVDAERILTECPDAQVLHVVRNPWSAYADTKKRPVPLSLEHYLLGWTLNQYHALVARRRFPERMHIVRAEDVMGDPVRTLGAVCERAGLTTAETLRTPTWNGSPLETIAPWGTIAAPTVAANREAAESLSANESAEIRDRASPYLEVFDYK
ncbi:MAG: sulfotransferase family protein [Vicinamibacterales bacterium]